MSKYRKEFEWLLINGFLKDEQVDMLEEAIEKAEKYDLLNTSYKICNTQFKLENDDIDENFIASIFEALGVEISRQYNKYKIIIDFLNDMEIKFNDYGFFFVANRVPKDKAFEILDIIKPNSDYVKELKAMLEVVENG